MRRTWRPGLLFALALAAPPADAKDFRLWEIEGLLDLTASYGLVVRTEEPDPQLAGIANGGTLPSVNPDDGTLNYETGVASNQIRGTGELTLIWRNFGAVVRGFAFYDFENELSERARTPLDSDALDFVGADAELRDAYLSAQFRLFGMPVQLRLGRQVVNWGESNFLRFGVDVVNPIDLNSAFQPAASARDIFLPQGMAWAAANVTESIAIEGFYQWEWVPARITPVGSFYSTNDLIGDGGLGTAFSGAGRFSDLGTDLDAAFGLPPGTLGFDRHFMEIPALGRDEPSEQGQYGFAVQALLHQLNSTKLGLHFVNYHGRLPLISGRTASGAALARTTETAVQDRADALQLEVPTLGADAARAIAENVTIGTYSNDTRYFVAYPEDIRMLGFSFNTATVTTGTLIAGEVSHHFDLPVQLPVEEVLAASLSPMRFTPQFTPDFGATSLGSFGPNETVGGFEELSKTQVSLSLGQLLGPRLGASATSLAVDVGYVYIHDFPENPVETSSSWGYRLLGQLTYTGVFGGVNVTPALIWTHDVRGTTPGPQAGFVERRKSFSAGLLFEYLNRVHVDLSYTKFFGGSDPLGDRDSFRLGVSYAY